MRGLDIMTLVRKAPLLERMAIGREAFVTRASAPTTREAVAPPRTENSYQPWELPPLPAADARRRYASTSSDSWHISTQLRPECFAP